MPKLLCVFSSAVGRRSPSRKLARKALWCVVAWCCRWSRVDCRRCRQIACDINEPPRPIVGAVFIRGDVSMVRDQLVAAAGGPHSAHVVLSDMAPSTTGVTNVDAVRAVECAQLGLALCERVLRRGGSYVAKLRNGAPSEQRALCDAMTRAGFRSLSWSKPPASRKESAEIFIVAQDFAPSRQSSKAVVSE